MITKEDNYWWILEPEKWVNEDSPKNWYAIGNNDQGIIAYFKDEDDAIEFLNTKKE